METKPILRWFLEQLLHLVFYILGVVVCLFIYPFRAFIRKHKITFLWYFLNDTTKAYKSDIDWGDYGRYKHNYFGYIQQCAFRNSHWNLRLLLRPKQGVLKNIQPRYSNLTFYNVLEPLRLGKQSCITYEINETKYFRASATQTIPFWWFGYKYYNYQVGYNKSRSLLKFRLKK